MKLFYLFLFIFSINYSFAATCTATSRTNYTTGQVLSSASLNADLNQLVTKANAMDGGCISDSTLEVTSFDSSFDAVKSGIRDGCDISYVDTNTVQIGKCILGVNGLFVRTSTTTNVTWGCTSCSAEVSSTQYYVYAKSGSTGTTLNLLISTGAPTSDGYDGSGNKILGRFVNNPSSNIDQYSISGWSGNRFFIKNTTWASFTPTFTGFGTVTNPDCWWEKMGDNLLVRCNRVTAGIATAVEARMSLPLSFTIGSSLGSNSPLGESYRTAATVTNFGWSVLGASGNAYVTFGVQSSTVNKYTNSLGDALVSAGEAFGFHTIVIPIGGWDND